MCREENLSLGRWESGVMAVLMAEQKIVCKNIWFAVEMMDDG